MRAASFRLAVATTVFATLWARSVGATSPPLEQLGLRDALLAKPEVIAALLPTAHQQLAQRFEDARRSPGSAQDLVVAAEPMPMDVVRAVDLGRLARGRDALIAGQVMITPLGVAVPFFTDAPADRPEDLPAMEGVPAGATADDEAAALRGTAGLVLKGLLHESEATRLVRVVSWPVAAVAIHNAVYVNAAWLIAMGPINSNPPAPSGSAGAPTEAGCGGTIAESAQGSLPTRAAAAYVSDPGKAEDARPRTSAPPRSLLDAPPLREVDTGQTTDTPQTLWAGSGAGSPGTSTTAEGLPISSLTYALDSAATTPTDCCRYTSDNGCDTQAPCQSSSSSCSSGSGSGCSSGSGSGCNSGSGSGCNSGSGSGCNSGSSSGCSSGSSSGCSSGSGSGCSSGSGSGCGSSSGSSCGSSGGGGCGKCTVTAERPLGNIPNTATLIFLLAPLAFLLLQERRWRR